MGESIVQCAGESAQKADEEEEGEEDEAEAEEEEQAEDDEAAGPCAQSLVCLSAFLREPVDDSARA